jgi:hypothetical protein
MLVGAILLAGCTAINTPGTQISASPAKPIIIANPSPLTKVTFTPLVPSVPLGLYVPLAGIGTSDGKPLPITEYTDAQVAAAGGVDPATMMEIDWWSGGGRPGTNLTNTPATNPTKMNYTTMLFGHTWRPDKERAVFNDIRTLQPGAVITLVTSSGTFYYKVVQQVVVIPKGDFVDDPAMQIDQPGRLVLTSCYRPPGHGPGPTDHNVAAIAQQFWPNASNGGD